MSKAKNKCWYLLIDRTPKEGSWNMAVDEFLFHSVKKHPRTYLRFYSWIRPTVSLGCSQRVEKVLNIELCRKKGIDIVRRMTGGKVVLHHEEVTYSIASSEDGIFSSSIQESYRLISEALMEGLRRLGLKPYMTSFHPASYAKGNLPCFSYPAKDEVEVNGKKIIGSAQKRVEKSFIQHGSIPLRNTSSLLKNIAFLQPGGEKIRMISLEEALDRVVEFDEVVASLVEGFSHYFQIEFLPKVLTKKDREKIFRYHQAKYSSPDWTFNKKGDVS